MIEFEDIRVLRRKVTCEKFTLVQVFNSKLNYVATSQEEVFSILIKPKKKRVYKQNMTIEELLEIDFKSFSLSVFAEGKIVYYKKIKNGKK